MNTTQNQSNDPVTPEPVPSAMQMAGTVEVDDLDQFVSLLTNWHKAKIATLRHLTNVPPGTSFEVGDESITLNGTALQAFKLGVELCIMQVGELPFVAETEDAPAEDAAS